MAKAYVSSGCKWAVALQAADLGAYCCGTAEQCRAMPSRAAMHWAEPRHTEQRGLLWAQSQHVCYVQGAATGGQPALIKAAIRP